MLKTEIEYELKLPFDVTRNGKKEQAIFVKVPSPNNHVISHIAVLESELAKANKSQQEEINKSLSGFDKETVAHLMENREELVKIEEAQKKEIKPAEMLKQLMMHGLDLEKCTKALKAILTNPFNRATVDGEINIIAEHVDNMSMVDSKNLLGLYITDFLLESPE